MMEVGYISCYNVCDCQNDDVIINDQPITKS